jgi:hypothetical protein
MTAVAASPHGVRAELTGAERRLAWLLRLLALLFAIGAVAFLLRPDDTVRALDRVGVLIGLPALPPSPMPMASDFWLALGVANMATIAACAWLAAVDVRARRALVYPIVVSKFASALTGLLLFARWSASFPFLAIALVDLPIAAVLLAGLRRARPGG